LTSLRHAAPKPALAAARIGEDAALTHNIEPLGQMICNPSIGVIGRATSLRRSMRSRRDGGATDVAATSFASSCVEGTGRACDGAQPTACCKAAIRGRLENQPNCGCSSRRSTTTPSSSTRHQVVVTQIASRSRRPLVVLTAGTNYQRRSSRPRQLLGGTAANRRRSRSGNG